MSTSITGCSFTGVKFNKTSIELLQMIASATEENAVACQENAKVLKRIAETITGSTVNIETLLKLPVENKE